MTSVLPGVALRDLARDFRCDVTSPAFAAEMDARDPLRHFRNEFVFPKSPSGDEDELYMCGQSLGLKPKRCDAFVAKVLDDWSNRGVRTHVEGFLPAASCENSVQDEMAGLVGAKPSEVAILNGLTVNLHLLMSTFYKPTGKRWKVMIEEFAFPSDMVRYMFVSMARCCPVKDILCLPPMQYAVKSQIAVNGFKVQDSLVTFKPRQGEYLLRHEDMLAAIANEGHQVALILLPGLQFLTGQLLDIQALTRAGQQQGCIVGVDLAHAVGNASLQLHAWGCDFAVWCTYKYLNAGPGSMGAIFVHERHCTEDLVHMQGWFGNKGHTRFDMSPDFDPDIGAARFKLSNTSPVLMAMLKASIEVFLEAGLDRLLKKQFLLTGYLELLLEQGLGSHPIKIVTPRDPQERGSQLSVLFPRNISSMEADMAAAGVAVDTRKGRTLRIAPVPLYNSFSDVRAFVTVLKEVLDKARGAEIGYQAL